MNRSALVGIAVTLVFHLGLVGGVAAFSDWDEDEEEDKDKKFFAIEAALAYKSDTPTNQPQKPRSKKPKAATKKPDPVPKPVPPDPNQPPKPKDPTPEPEQEDFTDDFERLLRERQGEGESEDEDTNMEEGPEDTQPRGQFDGSKHGFAEVSRGDPYMQKLAAQVYEAWELTTLEKGAGAAVGCVRLAADGSVVAHELWQATKNANIDLSVKNALAALQKTRKPGETPVPPHLMDATTQWTCFKFSVDGQ